MLTPKLFRYLIAYATYVSATINVHVAARQFPTSDAGPCLRTCLEFLNQNRETNPGVDNAKASLMVLMNRLGVICQDDQVSVGTRPDSIHQSMNRYPETDNPAHFPLIQSPSELSHSTSLDSRTNSNNSTNPNIDMDRILQSFTNGQLSTSPSSTSLSSRMVPAQHYHPAIAPSRDFHLANAYDTSLSDPVGIDYSQIGVGGGEQHDNYPGLVAYDGPVQYPGSMGTFPR